MGETSPWSDDIEPWGEGMEAESPLSEAGDPWDSENEDEMVRAPDGGFIVRRRPVDSPIYENLWSTQLKEGDDYPGKSSRCHFAEANRQTHMQFLKDPQFADMMERMYPGIKEHVEPGPRGAYKGTAPPSLSWHHHPEIAGRLELVPREQHKSAGAVQNTLHPDQRGGMQNWGR